MSAKITCDGCGHPIAKGDAMITLSGRGFEWGECEDRHFHQASCVVGYYEGIAGVASLLKTFEAEKAYRDRKAEARPTDEGNAVTRPSTMPSE